MFELTYRCNFKCRHCYVPQGYRSRQELKTREIFSILDQLKEMGCFYLGFTGGEPLMRKDILDILWHAKKIGFQIIIYSNGSLINEDIAQELQRLRPNKVDITILALSKTNFERITGVVGSWQRVFRAVDLLHKKGVKLGFKTCLLKENEAEIKAIEDFARSQGALHRLDDMLSPRLDGSREPYKYRGSLSMAPQQQNKDCGELGSRRTPNTEHLTPHTETLFGCGAGLSQAAITPQGELKLCLMINRPRYNIAEFSLKECWVKLSEFQERIAPDKNYRCDRCKLQAYCKWCPARGWLYQRSFTACAPESRKKAELNRQLLNC
jgi:radical SAM protein with 4Fe4S-binding SPASM domain